MRQADEDMSFCCSFTRSLRFFLLLFYLKVLNSSSARGEVSAADGLPRPGTLDLHWDLRLDGLTLKGDDVLDGIARGEGQHEVAAATRQLVAEQQAAASSDGTGRDGFSAAVVWSMMTKAASKKGKGQAAAAAGEGSEQGGDVHEATVGGKQYGYDW
jgi:hypothetical protein